MLLENQFGLIQKNLQQKLFISFVNLSSNFEREVEMCMVFVDL